MKSSLATILPEIQSFSFIVDWNVRLLIMIFELKVIEVLVRAILVVEIVETTAAAVVVMVVVVVVV